MALTGFENLFDAETLSASFDTLLKLGLAAVLGALVGIERDLAGRPAGIRTHMLVCVACALFTEISTSFNTVSPDRIAAQIVTGVGFLGAGTILRTGSGVKGLTTAASIFAVAAIGMATSVGGSFFWVAVGATVLTLITLRVVGAIEMRLLQEPRACLEVLAESREVITSVLSALTRSHFETKSVAIKAMETGVLAKFVLERKEEGAIAVCTELPGVHRAGWSEGE